ncbi:hypothetical protein ASPCADRAFT_395953 [Aspergillus carbonarius ITEM 5010]|uniref:Nineteen complex-related protein 2-domain-containing protein n=1 Tax=Aspergillus carbonarius (strain ITEM 5010) TaxID=602072 RepID=A0A1R3RPE2_ASPC5|nr:hypothetical protein ASPCADRAFT_395953 [Aspergillus carbonarius ITEM 5010]
MSSHFANRRKPRKIGGDNEEMDTDEQDSGPVVKRPQASKTKQKSKLRLSFGPGGTSMADDGDQESEVVIPKRPGLAKRALEKSALQRSLTPSGAGGQIPLRVGPEQDRPSYSNDYLKELRDSTPSTPKPAAEDASEKTVDVAAKFGEVMKVSTPAAIPSEAEIREKKARRARLAKEQGAIATEKDFISLEDDMEDDDWDPQGRREELRDTRLVRDDEDFAEGFDEFVEDGRISLGRKAEKEQILKQREEMRELIDDAEGLSDDEDSDLEEKAAYEASQTRAAMGGGKDRIDRPRTPPKMTSLPRLSNSLDRLRINLAVLEKSKAQMIDRMEELRKEKADIAVREVEIQVLIKEAGDNYEKLKQEAGIAPGSEENLSAADEIANSRGLEASDGDRPHLRRQPEATPIELFFDLFFVANLSSFTATHEINNVEALWAYIGFLGVIWFTWLQVTLFDIRFARDSIFERICKAVQLAAMVGFASAGTRFTTRVRAENVWAFQSLSLILGGSRLLLALQYTVNTLYYAFQQQRGLSPYIWTVWFVLFGVEMWVVMGTSSATPGIGLQDTHLNTRMGLLTLIIIGEGVIAVTRIVNKTYFLWQAYFDLSPRRILGKYSQQIWAQLHFPFHVALILLLEGSQILALSLDITLKLRYLAETILWACEEPRPRPDHAIRILRTTIADMEIDYSRGAINEQIAITRILDDLPNHPLCPSYRTGQVPIIRDMLSDLVGNVTAALFSTMRIMPSNQTDPGHLSSDQLLQRYMALLEFVYVYYFAVASLTMFFFGGFVLLARRHTLHRCTSISTTTRLTLGVLLASLVSFSRYFPLVYSFMTSPAILYAFTLTLLLVLLVDRSLDWYQSYSGRMQDSDVP